jgi:hypothetical protein
VEARDEVVWTRRLPRRAILRIWWLVLAGAAVLAVADLLFGPEPARLPGTGQVNPLSLVVPSLAGAFGVVIGANLVAAVRRPYVAADREALRLRPGAGRTLVLPWANVREIATVPVRGRAVLLVRCTDGDDGPRPRWWDQGALRDARQLRSMEPLTDYDIAVNLSDFVGAPYDLLSTLEEYAPEDVLLVDKLD